MFASRADAAGGAGFVGVSLKCPLGFERKVPHDGETGGPPRPR